MKLIIHEALSHVERTPRGAAPLIVWLDRFAELRIPVGTRLAMVADVIRRRLRLTERVARRLAAYWFTIGERQLARKHKTPWGRRGAQPGRRYGC